MVRAGWYAGRAFGSSIALATAVVTFGSIPADADMVYGRACNVRANEALQIKNARGQFVNRLTPDQNGAYRIFLPPGIYTVESSDRKATIRSIPGPIEQNIFCR